MNSTEPPRGEDPTVVAPAPLSGVLDEHLGMGIRAYERRDALLSDPNTTLRALQVHDIRLVEFGEAVRFYGPEALSTAALAFDLASPGERRGAAWSWLAAEQIHASNQREQLALVRYLLPEYRRAVRDAIWFVGNGELCQALIAEDDPVLHSLGIEVAGLLGLQALAPEMAARSDQGPIGDVCLLALARLGRVPVDPADTSRLLVDMLGSADPARQQVALDFLAVHAPRSLGGEVSRLLDQLALEDPPAGPHHCRLYDSARMIWTLRNPDLALSRLLQRPGPLDTYDLRTVALTGRVEGLIALCGQIEAQHEAQQGPPTVGQVDALRLLIGGLPLEWQLAPDDLAHQVLGLRRLVSEVLRRSGCPGARPAHLVGWAPDLPRRHGWPVADLRLRLGLPWRPDLTLTSVMNATHPMRRWLYAEQAALSRRPYPLSWCDGAWRQMHAIHGAGSRHVVSGHQ